MFGQNITNKYRYNYVQIPTVDLSEWFFICATYNPMVNEVHSIELDSGGVPAVNDKQLWLNHKNADGALSGQGMDGDILLGNRCKVEVISRSDLLRARGFKVGDDTISYTVDAPTQDELTGT